MRFWRSQHPKPACDSHDIQKPQTVVYWILTSTRTLHLIYLKTVSTISLQLDTTAANGDADASKHTHHVIKPKVRYSSSTRTIIPFFWITRMNTVTEQSFWNHDEGGIHKKSQWLLKDREGSARCGKNCQIKGGINKPVSEWEKFQRDVKAQFTRVIKKEEIFYPSRCLLPYNAESIKRYLIRITQQRLVFPGNSWRWSMWIVQFFFMSLILWTPSIGFDSAPAFWHVLPKILRIKWKQPPK